MAASNINNSLQNKFEDTKVVIKSCNLKTYRQWSKDKEQKDKQQFLHRKLKNEQQEVNPAAPEGKAVPAPLATHILLLLLKIL